MSASSALPAWVRTLTQRSAGRTGWVSAARRDQPPAGPLHAQARSASSR